MGQGAKTIQINSEISHGTLNALGRSNNAGSATFFGSLTDHLCLNEPRLERQVVNLASILKAEGLEQISKEGLSAGVDRHAWQRKDARNR